MMIDDLNASLDIGITSLLNKEGQLFDEQGQDLKDGRIRNLDLFCLSIFLY